MVVTACGITLSVVVNVGQFSCESDQAALRLLMEDEGPVCHDYVNMGLKTDRLLSRQTMYFLTRRQFHQFTCSWQHSDGSKFGPHIRNGI